jgi:hypothetical protein
VPGSLTAEEVFGVPVVERRDHSRP